MQRQTLLTNNLANADTPELPAAGHQLPADAGKRDAAGPAARTRSPTSRTRRTQVNGPDGNGVDAEQTNAEIAENGLLYQELVQVAAARERNPPDRDQHERLMSFFDAMNIAASGLTAERTRMDVTSENLANAETTVGANGGPYQRQEVVLQAVGGSFGTMLAERDGQLPGHAGRRRGGRDRQRPDARPARLRPGQPARPTSRAT